MVGVLGGGMGGPLLQLLLLLRVLWPRHPVPPWQAAVPLAAALSTPEHPPLLALLALLAPQAIRPGLAPLVKGVVRHLSKLCGEACAQAQPQEQAQWGEQQAQAQQQQVQAVERGRGEAGAQTAAPGAAAATAAVAAAAAAAAAPEGGEAAAAPAEAGEAAAEGPATQVAAAGAVAAKALLDGIGGGRPPLQPLVTAGLARAALLLLEVG